MFKHARDLEPTTQFKRILVTGGSGFIGSYLVRQLVSDGREVHVLHRPQSDLSRLADLNGKAHGHACDLLDAGQLRIVLEKVQPEVIYHLAGDASLRHFDPALDGVAESIDRNIRTSMNLVVTAANARLPDLARLGGLEEYGRGPLPYHESQREQPVSPYSASQVAVTHYLQMLAARLAFRSVTVRPALVYGAGQSTLFFIPSLIQHCFEGRDFAISSGQQGRDLIYIDDLIAALVLLLATPLAKGEIINIGGGLEYVMADVAALIVKLTRAKIKLVQRAATPAGQLDHLCCSYEKARTQLGWEPTIDLRRGLELTIDGFGLPKP